MTIKKDPLKPKCLIFAKGELEKIVPAFKRCGLQTFGVEEPTEFLKSLNKVSPVISIVTVDVAQPKVARALILSIRKILGGTIPIYYFLPPPVTLAEIKTLELVGLGESGIIGSETTLPELAQLLQRHVVTDEIAELIQVPQEEKQDDVKNVLDSLTGQPDVPNAVNWVFEKIFPAIAQLSAGLETLDDNEARVHFYAEQMIPIREEFIEMVNSLRKSSGSEAANLHQCVRFYGIQQTRALVVAERLLNVVRGSGLKWDTKAKRMIDDPSKIIAYAWNMSQMFEDSPLYREVAFNCGLLFDLLSLLADQVGSRKVLLKKELEARFKEAQKLAVATIGRSKQLETLPLAKHVITTFLLVEAGKIVMAINFQDYLETLKVAEKNGISVSIFKLIETKKFGVSHVLLGALLCQIMPGLNEAYPAVLFSYYPGAFRSMLGQKQEGYASLLKACYQSH